MTTGTGTAGTGHTPPGVAFNPDSLTTEYVQVWAECPLCGAQPGHRCEHPLSRLRAAVRAASPA